MSRAKIQSQGRVWMCRGAPGSILGWSTPPRRAGARVDRALQGERDCQRTAV